jgi:diacylglycerol kinase (ATP)
LPIATAAERKCPWKRKRARSTARIKTDVAVVTSVFERAPSTRLGRLWRASLNTTSGFAWAVRHERAVQEECLALALGVPLSFLVAAGIGWWLALVGSLLLLLIVELLNTAVEKLSDHVTPEHHAAIKVVKDLGSAAVFCALVFALLVWTAGLWARLA